MRILFLGCAVIGLVAAGCFHQKNEFDSLFAPAPLVGIEATNTSVSVTPVSTNPPIVDSPNNPAVSPNSAPAAPANPVPEPAAVTNTQAANPPVINPPVANPPAVANPPVATPPSTKVIPAKTNLIVTPAEGIAGKVVSVNSVGKFVVLSFPLAQMPAFEHQLNVYRRGLKVAELKVTGPKLDDTIVADVVQGNAEVGDDVRDR
jgi:hypothetical protein